MLNLYRLTARMIHLQITHLLYLVVLNCSENVICDQPLAALDQKVGLQMVSPKGKEAKTLFTRISFNGTSSVVKCKVCSMITRLNVCVSYRRKRKTRGRNCLTFYFSIL